MRKRWSVWANETCRVRREGIRWIRGSPRPCVRVARQSRKEGRRTAWIKERRGEDKGRGGVEGNGGGWRGGEGEDEGQGRFLLSLTQPAEVR